MVIYRYHQIVFMTMMFFVEFHPSSAGPTDAIINTGKNGTKGSLTNHGLQLLTPRGPHHERHPLSKNQLYAISTQDPSGKKMPIPIQQVLKQQHGQKSQPQQQPSPVRLPEFSQFTPPANPPQAAGGNGGGHQQQVLQQLQNQIQQQQQQQQQQQNGPFTTALPPWLRKKVGFGGGNGGNARPAIGIGFFGKKALRDYYNAMYNESSRVSCPYSLFTSMIVVIVVRMLF